MKKIVYIAAALVVFAACTKEKEAPAVNGEFTLTATMELPNDATKTAMSGTSVVWSGSEHINVFTDAGENIEFSTTESGASAIFTTASVPTGTPKYAIYPYSAGNEIAGSNITFTLPETQTYAANSFGPGANVSVGAIDEGTGTVTFYNTCGVLKLSLSIASGDAANVGRIELTDENNMLAGTFTADASLTAPTATYTGSDGSHTITLDCSTGSGVALSTTATDFYIVVPAGACSSGFTAKVYSKQNHLITTLSTVKNNTVARKTIMAMPTVADIPWLPAEYTECEYIQSSGTGTTAISTRFTPNQEFSLFMKVTLLEQVSNSYHAFFGASGMPAVNRAWIRLNNSSGSYTVFENQWYDPGYAVSLGSYMPGPGPFQPYSTFFTNNTDYEIEWVMKLNKRVTAFNGVKSTNVTDLTSYGLPCTQDTPIMLLCDGTSAFLRAKLYYCTILDGSDSVVRNFIPVYYGATSRYGLYEVSRTALNPYTSSYFYTAPNDYSGN